MNGLRLTKHIKRVTPQTAVIIMSGSAEINREDVLAAGGIDLIEKPILLDKLLAKIELALCDRSTTERFSVRYREPGVHRLRDCTRPQAV